MQRHIDDVVETLITAKDSGHACSLLIGAGCSVKAGIPTADGFVKVIQEKHPRAYQRAAKKTYPCCMSELSPQERRDLISEYINNARVNWAHLAIAQLMKENYVDRVLTTNFDPLVVKSCALLGLFPAVYDFAASQCFKPNYIPKPSVFYLHGQHTGFILMNTEKECAAHSVLLEPVFKDSGSGRVWIVVGYSGENDPVFEHLAKVDHFDGNLYWVGYKDNEPPRHVREKLLAEGKYAFYIKGFDADDFFVTLAQKLECFPPKFVHQPFSHLESILSMLTPYSMPGIDSNKDMTATTRKFIRNAAILYEKDFTDMDTDEKEEEVAVTSGHELLTVVAEALLMSGKYEQVIALHPGGELPQGELADTVTWAYIMQGNDLSDQASRKTGTEADSLFELAYQKYAEALKIKPDKHEALNNWGSALYNHALRKTGTEADCLFELSYQKYEEVLKINPVDHKAFNSWGIALSKQAPRKTDTEADSLFELAYQKYAEALKINPVDHDVLNNWGIALSDHAQRKTDTEADSLFELAYQKYEEALKIHPVYYEALNNWGNTLLFHAQTKTGTEAEELRKQAEEKLKSAESLQPGSGSYDLACLCALTGDPEGSQIWLQKAKEYGTLPSVEHILTDKDLESVRELDWFKEMIKE